MPLYNRNGKTIMSDGVSVEIFSGNINQRQAVAIAIGKGLRDAGFKDIAVTIEKCGDAGWDNITPDQSVSFLDSLKALNPGVFEASVEVVTGDPFEGDVQKDDTVTLKF
jgi:hypothetical protein